ncbi:MAG TPA: cytochrome c [Steroidobacteraceae bacterium]|nr:cytochrome c [Steroidobacteraceae bacterium]
MRTAGMRLRTAAAPLVPLAVAVLLTLSGCEKGMHDMYHQPRYDPLDESAFWADGAAARPPVPGTEISARGGFAVSSSGRSGYGLANRWDRDEYATHDPYPLSMALLERGRDRFQIYCTPCHGELGDGDGYIVRRGFPAPPSYHIERLRQAPDSHFFDVITHGYGLMYAYADRVSPADRWAIIAYIRALQLSQHAPATVLSAADRARLDAHR